jgi:sugar phosphate isomerase/epimerase
MSKLPVALQLYTVRDELSKDFGATVRRVAEIGYTSVEFAGTGDLSAKELKALLNELGLTAVGPHTGLDQLASDLDATLAYFGELGVPYITCPYMPETYRTPEMFGETCALLNRIGQACQGHGMQFCYHNHAFEFETRIGDKTLFDVLYDDTDPDLVKGELDVYWVQYAGYDPVKVIASRPGRFPLIHLKDMTAGEPTFAEVGEGILDMPAIFVASEANGAQWYVVEQDRCQRPTMESAKLSFENLTSMGKI